MRFDLHRSCLLFAHQETNLNMPIRLINEIIFIGCFSAQGMLPSSQNDNVATHLLLADDTGKLFTVIDNSEIDSQCSVYTKFLPTGVINGVNARKIYPCMTRLTRKYIDMPSHYPTRLEVQNLWVGSESTFTKWYFNREC